MSTETRPETTTPPVRAHTQTGADKVIVPTTQSRIVMLAVLLLVSAAFAGVSLLPPRPSSSLRIFFGAFTLMCAVGLIETFWSRIYLDKDALRIRGLRRAQVYPRADITSVDWADGVPVTISLRNGETVKLPGLGHSNRSLAATVAAWLRRTQP